MLVILARNDPFASRLEEVARFMSAHTIWLTKTLGGGRPESSHVNLSAPHSHSMELSLDYCREYPLPLVVLPEVVVFLHRQIRLAEMKPLNHPVVALPSRDNLLVGDVVIDAMAAAKVFGRHDFEPGFYNSRFDPFPTSR